MSTPALPSNFILHDVLPLLRQAILKLNQPELTDEWLNGITVNYTGTPEYRLTYERYPHVADNAPETLYIHPEVYTLEKLLKQYGWKDHYFHVSQANELMERVPPEIECIYDDFDQVLILRLTDAANIPTKLTFGDPDASNVKTTFLLNRNEMWRCHLLPEEKITLGKYVSNQILPFAVEDYVEHR